MPELSYTQIEHMSREKPPWERGCRLRLEHRWSLSEDMPSRGSIFTLESMSCRQGYWMVRLRECAPGLLCGRFTLIDDERPRIKTNHKIGAPKGKLP